MNRLTKKDYKEWVYVVGTTINQKASEHLNYINHKLGELEDLEDELGCPLEVVFNALKYGCYIQDEGYFEMPDIYFHTLEMEFVIGWANKNNMGYECLKDYKKTWWLKELKDYETH